jgi:cytohesin
MARLLIRHGATLNVRNKDNGATPLHEAAQKGHLDVVQVLLANGADPAIRDNSNATALDEALRYRHIAVVSLLMDKSGASSGEAAQRQLQDAVMRGQIDMVSLLLQRGADPNLRTASGSTLLHDAALKGYRDIAERLLASGARVNERNSSGATPLHDAALGGFRNIVELLIAKGADMEAKDSDTGATPLHRAASWGRVEALAALLAAGANPGAANKSGVSPLQAAIDNGQTEAADLLRRPKGNK